jgi:hypothetical protein
MWRLGGWIRTGAAGRRKFSGPAALVWSAWYGCGIRIRRQQAGSGLLPRDPRHSAQVGNGLSRAPHDQTQAKLKSRHRHCPERKSPGCLQKQGLPRTDLTRPSCARDLLQRPVSALPRLNGKEEVHAPLLTVLRCRVRPLCWCFPHPGFSPHGVDHPQGRARICNGLRRSTMTPRLAMHRLSTVISALATVRAGVAHSLAHSACGKLLRF